MQICHFRRFRQITKKTLFGVTKARFTEGTVFGTPGFEAIRTRKFTRKFDKIFVTQALWGTFSVPDLVGEQLGYWSKYVLPLHSPNPSAPCVWARKRPKQLGQILAVFVLLLSPSGFCSVQLPQLLKLLIFPVLSILWKQICLKQFNKTLVLSTILKNAKSCESWLAFLILELRNPPAISCGFLPCAPRKPHFSAGKCFFFLQESAFLAGNVLFCRKVHVFGRKTHFSAVCSRGSRIMSGSAKLLK